MLYHVSQQSGLHLLKPRVSSHGKPYVYAVDNLTMGLVFGARHDDFDFLLSDDAEGRPVLYECYPEAFTQVYGGKSCSVYTVSETGFARGVTGWAPELVCEREVPVQQEWRIERLDKRLLQEASSGRLIIHRYAHTNTYKKRIAEHIVDRLIRFDALERLDTDPRFQTHYQKLVEALRSVMDGHLL